MKSEILAVDFDDTVVTHMYPHVGEDIGAAPVLRKLTELGHRIILFTMRSGKELQDATEWFKEKNIPLWGINENPTQRSWTSSPKPYADNYIDDTAIGCPLQTVNSTRPYVDWFAVVELLDRLGYFEDMSNEDYENLIDEIDRDCNV